MTGEVPLQALLLSPLVLLVPAAILACHRVRLVKDALVAVARMAVQFAFVGLYLGYIFEMNDLRVTLAWTAVMVLVAAKTALGRTGFPWRTFGPPIVLSLTVGMLVPLAFIVWLVEAKLPFLDARTTIPFCGMILGHGMKNVVIALRTFSRDVADNRGRIVWRRALGATTAEALRPSVRRALADALSPHIANMAVAGLVTLPGMMTGVMVGGASPVAAVEYQWLLMTAVFAAKALTSALALYFISRRKVFDRMSRIE